MKTIFLLPILFVAQLTTAQQTCEMQFQLISNEPSEGTIDTMFIDLAQTRNKFALNYRFEEMEERFVLDSTAKKVVELANEDGEKIAFVNDLGMDDGYGFTTAYDILNQEMLSKDQYRLLTDKKTIQGWDCRKIELLEVDGSTLGAAWVALGLHIGYQSDAGFFYLKEGTIIEYSLTDNETKGSLSLKLIKSSKTIANPAKTFSLEIPAGYELDTMEDDYYDDEEEE
ncbi:MAG: hypothetical protein V4604_00260 [Bacteroidota bacterium]